MKTWKQALALVLALVMALSLVALPSFAEGEESTGLPNGVSVVNPGGPTEGVTGMEMSKTLQLNADGKTGTLTLEAYATGQSQVVYSAKPVDIVLVLDVSGSMNDKVNGTKKIVALQNAVNSFIDTVADKCKDSEEKSNIAIVKFSGNKTDKVGNDTYGEGWNYSQTVKELTSVEQKDALKQAVNGLTARGATCADYGMELARDILLKDTSDNPKVVIMFTDGTPTAFNGFEKPVADAAISASHQIKANGATVYTVGIFGDLNGSQKVYDTRDHGSLSAYQKIKPASNVVYGYMNAVSSNDTTSTSLNLNNLDKTVHDKFMTASSAAELEKIFTQIGNETGGSDASLTDTATMVDVISEYFQLPDNYQSSLKAYTVPFTGTDASGNRQWGANQTDYTTSINVEGSKVSIAGFNYSDNWVGFHTANGTQTARGSKMVLEIPIQVKDGTVDEVPTNDLNNSGILDGNGDMFAKFVSPVVKYAYFTVVPVISSVNENGKNQGNPGTEKKVRLLDSPTYNLVNEVPEGYLYGGTFNEEACTTVHDKVEGQNPMAIAPVENATYYIWEVPNTYLTPRNYNVWRHLPENNGQKTVVRLYPLTAADRTLYKQVGFVIDDKDYVSGCDEFNVTINNTPTLYQTAVAEQNGQHYQTLYLDKGTIRASNTAIDESGLVSGQHIDDGCLAGIKLDANGMIKFKPTGGVTFRPYWITLDNVKVYGTTARTCTYVAGSESTSVSDDKTSLSCVYMGDTVTTQAMSFAKSFTMADSQPAVDESLTVTVVDGSNTTQVKVAPNGSVRDQVAYQAPAGKVFAGWFADQAYTTPADLDQVTQDTTIYAKYVSDSYLDLAYSRTGLFRLRGVTLISAVDNPANYQASGIMVNGQKIDVSYASRYRIFKTPANLFGAARDAKLMLADKSLSGTGTLEVTPYWITLDGTEVHGITHSLHYNTRTIWE